MLKRFRCMFGRRRAILYPELFIQEELICEQGKAKATAKATVRGRIKAFKFVSRNIQKGRPFGRPFAFPFDARSAYFRREIGV